MMSLHEWLHPQGGTLTPAGAHEDVRRMLDRGGLTELVELVGESNLFWSADQVVVAAEKHGCGFCGTIM